MKPYFCFQCKNFISSLDQVCLVEDGHYMTFCSKDCAKSFFGPLKDYFKNENETKRRELGLLEENGLPELEDLDTFKSVLREKTRIYVLENEFGFKVTSYLSEMPYGGKTIYFLFVCLEFNDVPSLTLFQSYSFSQELLEALVCGEELCNESNQEAGGADETSASEEEVELNEENRQRKSELFDELLLTRKDTDISLKDFDRFDKYLRPTLVNPDEVFEWKEDSKSTYSYVKGFESDGLAFRYFVLCVHDYYDEAQDEEVLLPIFGFPTSDEDVYTKFSRGEQILGNG